MDPILAALGLAYVSNLFGSITHYASGQAAAYYGAGYLKILPTFIIGGIFGIGNLVRLHASYEHMQNPWVVGSAHPNAAGVGNFVLLLPQQGATTSRVYTTFCGKMALFLT